MLDWLSSFPKTLNRLECSPIKEHLCGYLGQLTEQGYPPQTLRQYAERLLGFGEFLEKRGFRNAARYEELLEPYLADLACRITSAAQAKPTLNCFLRHLRQTGVIPARDALSAPILMPIGWKLTASFSAPCEHFKNEPSEESARRVSA